MYANLIRSQRPYKVFFANLIRSQRPYKVFFVERTLVRFFFDRKPSAGQKSHCRGYTKKDDIFYKDVIFFYLAGSKFLS